MLARCALIAFAVHVLLALAAWAIPRLTGGGEATHRVRRRADRSRGAARRRAATARAASATGGSRRSPSPPKPPEVAPPPDTPTLREPAAPKPRPGRVRRHPRRREAGAGARRAAAAEPEVQGSERGSTNALALGAAVAGLDNPDFVYGYYVDQMLAMIQRNWVRPMVGSGVEATVHYRIQRDGRIVDVRIATSSGINSFDLAALRAVQASTPLPPLPRAFREGSLGVNLIFR